MTTTASDVLIEGKAKIVRQDTTAHQVRVIFKDCATAFNGEKFSEIPGKGELNAKISGMLFQLLEEHHIPTCFVALGESANELVYNNLTMIPLEVVVRNHAYGSVCKRFGFEQGMAFKQPLVEYFLKNDAANDPQITESMIQERGSLPASISLSLLERRALQINEIFVAFFEARGIRCADFKLEFGVDAQGVLMLGDELSPDNFRLRDVKTAQVLDKDVFRLDLADLIETYQTLLKRMEAPTKLALDQPRTYWAQVFVKSRKNILNPESKAILTSLHNVGFTSVNGLQAGKRFEVQIEANTMMAAERQLLKIAEDVLSNPVIEDFELELGLSGGVS